MKRNILNSPMFNYSKVLNNYIKLLAFCCLLIIVSCKAKKAVVVKPATSGKSAESVNSTKAKLDLLRGGQTFFNTFSGKARTKLDINGSSNDVTLNIRIQRDKKIWVSITAIAGIEVARALITPDSLLVINRLQGVYLKQPFSYIGKFTGNQINYKSVESLLIGNAIPEMFNDPDDLITMNDTTTLIGNLQALTYQLVIGPGLKAVRTNLTNKNAGQSMQVNNNTFVQSGNKIIPSQIDISSALKDKKIQINLHYVKFDFDQPLEYPFSIPSRYQPAD